MAISYNQLGSNGRLGNQMFQYAGLRGIAANRGFDWLIPPQDAESTCNYGLFDCFRMQSVEDKNIGFGQGPTLTTGNFHFDEELFNSCPDNTNLNDYLQTEKYFSGIEKDIRRDFAFKDDIYTDCKEIIDEVGDCIFIHVRRGDYIATPDHHPCLTEEYYLEGLSHFDNDIPVLVFSDDLDWCNQQKFLEGDRFLISENHVTYSNKIKLGDGTFQHSLVPYWDMCLMTMCKGAIIANSSMSWWGAWLQNDAGKVVAPKRWLGKAFSNYNMSDVTPDRWVKI